MTEDGQYRYITKNIIVILLKILLLLEDVAIANFAGVTHFLC